MRLQRASSVCCKSVACSVDVLLASNTNEKAVSSLSSLSDFSPRHAVYRKTSDKQSRHQIVGVQLNRQDKLSLLLPQ